MNFRYRTEIDNECWILGLWIDTWKCSACEADHYAVVLSIGVRAFIVEFAHGG